MKEEKCMFSMHFLLYFIIYLEKPHMHLISKQREYPFWLVRESSLCSPFGSETNSAARSTLVRDGHLPFLLLFT
jgi:hypothetical protein